VNQVLLSEAVEKLCTATLANGRSSRPVQFYRGELARLLAFLGDVAIVSVTVDDLRRYVASLMQERTLYAGRSTRKPQRGTLSPFSVAANARAVRRLFNWLESEGHIAVNPMRRIRAPKPRRKEPKGVSAEDVKALLATTEAGTVADLRDRSIILFLYDSGCRVGGLCGLQLDDVYLSEGRAIVTEKGEKTRYAMFSPVTAEALRRWLEVRPEDKGPGVFVGLSTKSTGALTPHGVGQMLRRRAKLAGCKGPTNPHSFRHAFARAYCFSGGDLATLARILGHSDIKVTVDYYALYTVGELQAKHARHSPIVQMFGGEDGSQYKATDS
jgi:site-specific recombinase XerD